MITSSKIANDDYRQGYVFFTGKKGYKEVNKILKRLSRSELARIFMEGQREVQVGDKVLAGNYYEGYGLGTYQVVGETAKFWKVQANSSGYGCRTKIAKDESVYILENGSN